MSLTDYAAYGKVLSEPKVDAHRLALASEMSVTDLPRATLIRVQLQEAAAELENLLQCRDPDFYFPPARDIRTIVAQHGARWAIEEGHLGGLLVRGLPETVSVSRDGEQIAIAAIERFPILHLWLDFAPAEAATTIQEAVGRASTLYLRNATDTTVASLLRTQDLSGLRQLAISGDGDSLSMRSIEMICEAKASMAGLESLIVDGLAIPDPTDGEISLDYGRVITHSTANPIGEALERRYGDLRFLHARTRFVKFPLPLGVYDILPTLPCDLVARARISTPES